MSERKTVTDTNGVRYELGKLLGRGGQGTVYAVKGGRLAAKLVAGQRREQIRNQLALVRRLPIEELSLAKPLELLRPPHTGYVMELLTGMESIKRLASPPKGEAPGVEWYLRTGGIRRRLKVLARAARVLAQLHGKGLSYADPSPGNIFMSSDPLFSEVCFIDTDNLRYESRGTGIYTPGYGAPELVRGKSGVTTLTDVHAFAVIAFEALVLAHPFRGDLVNDGDPELEDQAHAGLLPWIDDTEDDRNRSSHGIERSFVLSKRLKETFEKAFGAGRLDPMARPGAAEWAERLSAAANTTVPCSGCGGAFYLNQPQCPWCDVARPTFALLSFHLWDPGNEDGSILMEPHKDSKRRVTVDHAAVASANSFIVTRRLAFDDQSGRAEDPAVEVSLNKDQIAVKSLCGEQFRLVSATGARESVVTEQARNFRVVPGQVSWSIHFGEESRMHRVLSFQLRPGSEA